VTPAQGTGNILWTPTV